MDGEVIFLQATLLYVTNLYFYIESICRLHHEKYYYYSYIYIYI
jgi:hypothetical protein